MAYTTIHTKANGARYLYSVEGHWDSEKKQSRNKQVCLGRIDDETGELIPSERTTRTAKRAAKAPEVTARSRVIGPHKILKKVCDDIGLEPILKSCFPGRHEHILSLAFFLAQKGLPLSRCEGWSVSNMHPYGDSIPSQRISELLKTITEDERQTFFKKWMRKITEKDYLCYDLTSVSSYSELNEYVKWGHNRDHEKLPQINLGMLFGQKSALPAYYMRVQGSTGDVSMIKNTIGSLDFIGQTKLTFVMDRGFYSKLNVNGMFTAHMGFILGIPHRDWINELYDRYRDEIFSARNRRETGENEVLYVLTHLHKWNDRRCYVHIYYNNFAAAAEADAFDLKLTRLRDELIRGEENKDHAKDYAKYFIIKETPKRGRKVIENEKAVSSARKKYSGFFSIMTTKKMEAVEALDIYRRKEVVENCFDDLKNALDMNRLRMHTSQTVDARLFIQFIALILLTKTRCIAKQHPSIKHLGVREIFEKMETIVEVTYSGRYGKIITEVDPLQRDIIDAFGVSITDS
jgi:transposase